MSPYKSKEEREMDYARRRERARIMETSESKTSQLRAQSKFFELEILGFINAQSSEDSKSLKQIACERI